MSDRYTEILYNFGTFYVNLKLFQNKKLKGGGQNICKNFLPKRCGKQISKWKDSHH